MAIRTLSGCSRSATALRYLLLAAAGAACNTAPETPPTLSRVAAGASARTRAQALLRVALAGPADERAAAALLWGLAACEADSPTSAVTAFALAKPVQGAAALAAIRLEAALERSSAEAALWRRAAEAPWLPEGSSVRLLLRGAETLARQGRRTEALALLPAPEVLPEQERWRSWGVVALAGLPERKAACRIVALEAPERLATLCPEDSLAASVRSFNLQELVTHAEAWLRAGRPAEALRAAQRAGTTGALVGARAALALRRPERALALLVGNRSAPAHLLRAEAHRQRAWQAGEAERRRIFPEVIAAADAALRTADDEAVVAAPARLLQAEAFVELGRWERGLGLLAASDPGLPRWEWVRRRGLLLARDHPDLAAAVGGVASAGGQRGQRLAFFWLGRSAARHGDTAELERLRDGGFPDLPALWAARLLGGGSVSVQLSEEPPAPTGPPSWASPLLARGRVADVALGWRAELERGPRSNPAWLTWVEFASPRPVDAIPLLLRGEPRLLAGPWSGLPRDLLARYLPLPWREEVERAAGQAGVPAWLLAALVRQESAWNPLARSPAGAVGLAQLMPATARELIRTAGYSPGWGRQLTDPEVNLTLGARLLANWRRRFDGSWTAALACYNGGERRIRVAWERAGRRDGPEFVEGIEMPETWDYVHRVVLFAEGYRLVYWPEGRGYPWTSSR